MPPAPTFDPVSYKTTTRARPRWPRPGSAWTETAEQLDRYETRAP